MAEDVKLDIVLDALDDRRAAVLWFVPRGNNNVLFAGTPTAR